MRKPKIVQDLLIIALQENFVLTLTVKVLILRCLTQKKRRLLAQNAIAHFASNAKLFHIIKCYHVNKLRIDFSMDIPIYIEADHALIVKVVLEFSVFQESLKILALKMSFINARNVITGGVINAVRD